MATRTLTGAAPRRTASLLVAALVLTGLSMRTAVTSVGAALDELQDGLSISGGVAGLITTLPVICFAGMGALAPRLSRRFGQHRLLVASLAVMTAGLVLRAIVGQAWAFIVLSVLALAGGAISNVLLPSVVKRHFPDLIGRMTAIYVAALSVGQTAASGLTVPIGSLGGGWRMGLGSWALLSAVAILPWLPTLRRDRPAEANGSRPRTITMGRLMCSPTAWALTIMFAFQSFQAYVAFGWFAKQLASYDISASEAGWMVAVLSALTIPMSILTPLVPQRWHRHLLVALGVCGTAAYLGMAFAPAGGAWAWMVLDGVNMGMFPLVLAMLGQHARTSESTAALSAFVQSIGYVLAGTGPLLFGVLHSATGGWGAPMVALFVALALSLAAGWRASRQTYVDDELTGGSPHGEQADRGHDHHRGDGGVERTPRAAGREQRRE